MKKIGIATEAKPDAWRSIARQMLDLLVNVNAQWYLDEWAQGRDPPTDPRGAGVLWVPDPPRHRVVYFPDAATVIRTRRASCGPIAAMVAGARAATRIRRLVAPSQRAIGRVLEGYGVELQSSGAPAGWPANTAYFHAVVRTPDGLVDPTEGMARAA